MLISIILSFHNVISSGPFSNIKQRRNYGTNRIGSMMMLVYGERDSGDRMSEI